MAQLIFLVELKSHSFSDHLRVDGCDAYASRAGFASVNGKQKRPGLNDDQGNVEAVNADRKQFNSDLCEALVNANIPLSKLENKSFRSFLEKYTGNVVPDESTLRKNYVDFHYNTTMNKIRIHAGNSKIWVSIDESTDVTGRYIANMIIGTLGSWRSIEDLFVKYSTTRQNKQHFNCPILCNLTSSTVARWNTI